MCVTCVTSAVRLALDKFNQLGRRQLVILLHQEKILLAERKDKMGKKKGLKSQVEENENMLNLYENLKLASLTSKD